MGSCSQRSCSSRSNIDKKSSGISFHRFPKDPERRDIWIKFVNRGKWKPTKYSVLCSKHFLEKDIDRTSLSSTRLKDTAVPIAYITQMECKEDMKDYRNEQISTCIKDETDSLKEYNIKVQSEVEENHLKSSNGQEYVLHEDFSDGIKIENNILDDLTNEIKVEIKKELEEYSMG
ncbi:THAP domain-containing protein 1 A-like [Diabrotica undecimpunctata]|uniref:THAP domain-containing protein 1 A-like n=1 Tax=Diabrotica undecimpunctata TaxID=50387 RepID=UPI003B633703